jgi:hypothetical protein
MVEGKGQVRSHMPDGGQPQVAWDRGGADAKRCDGLH